MPSPVSFGYRSITATDIVSKDERAQSVCFISRYDNLPFLEFLNIEQKGNDYYLENISYIRHILNEYRSIVSNEQDSVYFQKVHNFCHQKMANQNPDLGLSITVSDVDRSDVTELFRKILGERNKSIRRVLELSEFDYIYNGILQHSDHKFTDRFWKEYHSGRLNYVFLKHAKLLGYIKECLYWHYVILNQITFPKLGPLNER